MPIFLRSLFLNEQSPVVGGLGWLSLDASRSANRAMGETKAMGIEFLVLEMGRSDLSRGSGGSLKKRKGWSVVAVQTTFGERHTFPSQ